MPDPQRQPRNPFAIVPGALVLTGMVVLGLIAVLVALAASFRLYAAS